LGGEYVAFWWAGFLRAAARQTKQAKYAAANIGSNKEVKQIDHEELVTRGSKAPALEDGSLGGDNMLSAVQRKVREHKP
jgi:hypothetical protein